MDRLKYFFAAVFLMANAAPGVAQNTTDKIGIQNTVATAEQIFIHTNTAVLLTGETLHCRLYCINPATKTLGTISKIAYIELIDKDKKTVLNQKIALENGLGLGDFFIPATLKTGNYKLIGYTQWMLNFPASVIFQMNVSIINPFQPLPEANVASGVFTDETIKPGLENNADKVISFESGKTVYRNREKVALKFNLPGKGNYSVSVRKKDVLPTPENPNLKALSASLPLANYKASAAINYLPELRGELVTGNLLAKNGTASVSEKNVALSIPGKSYTFKIVKTNRQGKFVFILDQNPDASEIIVQVMDEDRASYTIQLDQPQRPDISGIAFLPELKFTPDLKSVIEQRSIANQIENAYYEKKKDSISKIPQATPFYEPLQKTYVLDDYTRFPTLKETITEVILEMYSKKNKNNYSIHLRNNTMDPEIYGVPLVLVDGLLIQDSNELYDYNTENIYKVDLINEPYVFGPKTFSGLANFVTKNTDYETKASGDFLKRTTIQRPIPQKLYFNPEYASTNQNARIPDYRQQLLWIPQITDVNNWATFYTSDSTGIFEIIIEGFTENGDPLAASANFEVK